MKHFKMDWEFPAAEDGNIALTGEIDLRGGDEVTIAIALGSSCQSTGAKTVREKGKAAAVPGGKKEAPRQGRSGSGI